ncbi:HlyD family type I secretion periplasmic adaptor subunit [Rhodobacteraceae bacterium HSP-20]|uniref:Membrane fusion protein (MFP) family protein n=1 Tax=Paragemmobacter amnigenus TaxID=2852097 RepID=A0ABS6J2D0_9RHOB|nr:HlyD family type I secretion periplasmic adaptor subunit [Rhodobacter amnigenus]MBU9697592.1 HlyD family type I secretion periplasmic adaptor subunit [Rhodobacter amnigenus]MBV4388819.1 HlyD family type I secretion periplasmic adaptor subunit [Rhodobacter amnigenus]
MTDSTRAWSARGSVLTGLVTLALLGVSFLVWGIGTTLDAAIVAPGQIEVESNRQIVQHPDGGVIASIAVTEGQSVAAGDLLLSLDGNLLSSELAIVEGQLFESRARRARLEAERDDAPAVSVPPDLAALAADRADVAEQLDGQLRLFDARRDTLARQTEQLARRKDQTQSQIAGIDAQAAALATQLDLIEQELADQQSLLDKGLAQSGRVLALQREQAGLQGQIGELAAARAQAEGRETEFDLEILRLAAARREEASTLLRDIGSSELELAERRRALTERVARLDIRAPVAGTVLGLAVTTPRAVIRPADPILYIVPQDRPLVIAARISPIHVDEIQVGQSVRVVLPAFPSRTTPELEGILALVSADALVDQATGQSYYRAEVTLPPDQLRRLGDLALLPGMPVETYIRTGARTPMAYLLQPFTDYFRKAFRES